MSKNYYLTTPLYYVNGVPHVGHVYTTVIADAIARYKRMCGLQVCSLTGTDEHGLKIERAALEQGMEPRELTNHFSQSFREAWEKLGISFDEFIRTTESRHYQTVSQMFERIRKSGFIYLGEYSGNYCVNCEAYVPKGQKNCPDCGRPTEAMSEESYFFKLSAFEEKLLQFYEDNPEFVIPKTRMNEIISFVKGGLRDLSISRTSFRWGIPVPGAENHIFYVWFDALNGYLSGIGFADHRERFDSNWPADVQLIGKDILRFHAVYWPAFLMAAGMEPPRHILVNGWWTVNGEKMSKSRGNFITAEQLSRQFSPDYVKYFMLREIPVGGDGDFSIAALIQRINSDLANDLGNLANRVLKMIENYFEGKVPERADSENTDEELVQFSLETIQLYRKSWDRLQMNKALDHVWELISVANKYIVANEPWAMARDSSRRERLGSVLYNSAEAVRIIAILLGPIVPLGAAALLKQVGFPEALDDCRIDTLKWGGLKSGSQVGPVEAVFPRLDLQDFSEVSIPAQEAKSKPSKPPSDSVSTQDEGSSGTQKISIEDFAKVEMRVGRIVSAEPIPRSSKLLKLRVDIGTEVRQVVAGIGTAYEPQSLVDRLVVLVTNLQPATLMGVESNGMIVAASEGGKPVLAGFLEPVAVGSRLK